MLYSPHWGAERQRGLYDKRNEFMKTGLIILLSLFSLSISGQGNWTKVETTNEANKRHENAFVELGGKYYLLGGRGIKPVNVFNPKSNTWKSLSKPPLEIHHFQAVVVKDEIWIAGAMTGKYPNERPLDHILIYHPESDSWKEGPQLPADRLRGSCGVVLQGNYLIMIAGIYDGHNGDHKTWVDAYNIKTKEWEVWPDAPRPRDHFAAVLINKKIVCAGGRLTSKSTGQVFQLTIKEVDIFDLKTKTWTTAKANLPTGRAGASSVAYKGKVVVIGGESKQKPAHNQVEAFDVKTGEWETWSPLLQGRHGTQAFVYKGKIVISAGSGNQGGGPELSSIEEFIK